jgi:hypothetical protein
MNAAQRLSDLRLFSDEMRLARAKKRKIILPPDFVCIRLSGGGETPIKGNKCFLSI